MERAYQCAKLERQRRQESGIVQFERVEPEPEPKPQLKELLGQLEKGSRIQEVVYGDGTDTDRPGPEPW